MQSRRCRHGKVLLTTAMTAWFAYLIAAAPAFAHDKLIGSNPVDGSTVDAGPKVVTLYFEEPPGSGFSSLKVLSPSAHNIDLAAPSITGSQMSVPVSRVTESGVYTIQFNIISDDGHPVGGVLHFTVSAAHLAAPSNSAAAGSQTKSPQSSSLGWIAFGAVAIAAIALVRLAMKSIRSRTSSAR